MSDVTTYYYRGFRIDLHPYAGGFMAYVYPPGGIGFGLAGSPIMVGPDGLEAVLRERILQDCRVFIDRQLVRTPV